METMKQWEKTEEEEGALRGRLLAQQRSTDANDATTGDFIFSSETSSEEEMNLSTKRKEIKGLMMKRVSGTQSESSEISRFNRAHVDVSFQMSAVTSHHDEGDIAKGEELPGFGSSPSKQSIEQNRHYNSFSNGTTDHGNGTAKTREIGEQEASELYLERLYQKPAAHDFYCPHCNTCITKVIIRGQELEITPPAVESAPPKPVDPIRCTSCFIFLIPAANWFSPKLVPKDEDSHIEQGTNIQDQRSPTALQSKDHVSNDSAGAKPTTPAQSVGVEFEAPSHDLNETLYCQKPTMSAPSVGVEFSVPSHDLNVTFYGPKPTLSAQSDGVTAEAKPSGNNSESSIAVQVPESTTVIIMQSDPATITEQGDTKSLEILKSIVYGGLTEAITSLSVVTSAASADTATLNIIALALANLFGGLFVIGHKLWELKSDQSRVPSSETDEQVDRYEKVLGKRENFFLHASVAILSFLVFGLVPPLVYGFSFRQSNNRDLKIAAVASASLLCIIALAIGKAYIHKPPKYIKTLLYYIAIGIGVGGVSYLAGVLIDKLIEKLGWFASDASGTLLLPKIGVVKPALESY